MAARISATEAARRFSDVLNRVKYKGEEFIVERNGEVVCKIVPADRPPQWQKAADWVDSWKKLPKPDPGFWDDVEEGIRQMNQPLPLRSPWDEDS
jgi:prevent-host-death family protein